MVRKHKLYRRLAYQDGGSGGIQSATSLLPSWNFNPARFIYYEAGGGFHTHPWMFWQLVAHMKKTASNFHAFLTDIFSAVLNPLSFITIQFCTYLKHSYNNPFCKYIFLYYLASSQARLMNYTTLHTGLQEGLFRGSRVVLHNILKICWAKITTTITSE